MPHQVYQLLPQLLRLALPLLALAGVGEAAAAATCRSGEIRKV
jgi:hypothetical protein